MNAEPKRLRVWWVVNPPPQETEKGYPVKDIEEAVMEINELAQGDLKNPIVEMNAQGLEVFEDGEWDEWYDEDGFDIIQVMDGESEIYDENGRRKE